MSLHKYDMRQSNSSLKQKLRELELETQKAAEKAEAEKKTRRPKRSKLKVAAKKPTKTKKIK